MRKHDRFARDGDRDCDLSTGLEVGFVRAKLVISYLRVLEEVIDYLPAVRALVSRDTESIVRYATLNFCTHLPLFILLLLLGIFLSLLDLVPFVGLIAELLVVDGTHNFGELGQLALQASNLLLVLLHGHLGITALLTALITTHLINLINFYRKCSI